MRCTDTRRVLDARHRDKTIGRICAAALASRLHGAGGQDTCASGTRRGAGSDHLLDSGAGIDRLVGGIGRDSLTGVIGADIFTSVNRPLAASTDHIADFDAAADTIHLSCENVPGLRPFGAFSLEIDPAQFVANASGSAASADTQLIYETDTGRLLYDQDGTGSGMGVLLAILDGAPALSASDFYLQYSLDCRRPRYSLPAAVRPTSPATERYREVSPR